MKRAGRLLLLPRVRPALLAAILGLAAGSAGRAQTSAWDAELSNTQWYVPAENLLAYVTPGTNLAAPQAVADQTIWTLGVCTDGLFGGTSVATFKLGNLTATSTTTMSGLITESGQVRIRFTSDNGSATVGLGQARPTEAGLLLEMQMMTGSGGADGIYITHWAYMAKYDGNPATLPPLVLEPSLLAEEWRWMNGTAWSLASAELFGPGGTGQFVVQDYRNGYFWGVGEGPADSPTETFSLLGSATPEGNILFNLLDEDGALTSLTGLITGDPATGAMALRSYDPFDGFGDLATAHVIPEPWPFALALGALLPAMVLRRRGNPRRADESTEPSHRR